MRNVPLTAMMLSALDQDSPEDAAKLRADPSWSTAHKIGIVLGGDLGAACSAYAGALKEMAERQEGWDKRYEKCVERAIHLLGRMGLDVSGRSSRT